MNRIHVNLIWICCLSRLRFSQCEGYVGIGTTNPGYLLHVNTDSAGKPGAGGLWTVPSDERIKENISLANLDRCYEARQSNHKMTKVLFVDHHPIAKTRF